MSTTLGNAGQTSIPELPPVSNAVAEHQTLLKYEAILNKASVGIAFTKDRAFQHAHRAFEELFARPADGLVGQTGMAVWGSPEEYSAVGSVVDPLLSKDKSVKLERRKKRRGTQFWCRLQARPVDPVNPLTGGTIWMGAVLQARLKLENDLHLALSRNELELYYQPRIDFASGTVIGYEALLRWNHPEDGLIEPSTFIPIAEDSGLIILIGEWMIREACQQMKRWRATQFAVQSMAVNLSARQFFDSSLPERVQQALLASDLRPEQLELEITESIPMANTEETMSLFARLRRLRVKLSINDFGTGFSSLAYLQRFHVDNLKIDRSFVRDIGTDSDDAAIVRAIVNLAQSLQLRVIAEGVETREQLDFLAACGCQEAQGFYFAHPQLAATVETRAASACGWI